MAKPGNPHGISGYKRRGCRCDICLAANVKYNADRRKHKHKAPRIKADRLVAFIHENDDHIGKTSKQVMERWLREGIDLYVADAACVRRGVHPFEVFGDDWWAIPIEGEDDAG